MRVHPELDLPPVRSRPSGLRRAWLPVAVLAGLVLGPLDLAGQVGAPYPWAHLFNSPAIWATAAFAWGRWAHDRWAGPIGGVVLLVVAVEAYYLADVVVRDADPSNLTSATAAVWLVAAVAAGGAFGTAGHWAAATTGPRAVLGRAALPAVLGGEAVYAVARVVTEPADGRPSDLGAFAVLLAVAHQADDRALDAVDMPAVNVPHQRVLDEVSPGATVSAAALGDYAALLGAFQAASTVAYEGERDDQP